MSDLIDPSRTTYRFVHNPHSGNSARNARIRTAVEEFIRAQRLNATVVETDAPTHATRLARQAVDEGCDVVVAMGGDGTMNEVAQAVVGSPVIFGLIPGGSGNGLGRHLGLQGSIPQVLETLIRGRIRSIDTGEAAGHPFFNVMGVGYDAALSERFNRLTRRGLRSYLREGIKLWRSYPPARYTIRQGDTTVTTEALMVAVANSDQYGYDCYIAPGARVDDALLNLVVVKPISALQFGPLAFRMRWGTADRSPHVRLMSGTQFIIETDRPQPIHTDGEVRASASQLVVNAVPRSLRMLVPA